MFVWNINLDTKLIFTSKCGLFDPDGNSKDLVIKDVKVVSEIKFGNLIQLTVL